MKFKVIWSETVKKEMSFNAKTSEQALDLWEDELLLTVDDNTRIDLEEVEELD